MDLLREPLPAGPFDLVHARLLLGHRGDPVPVLKQWLGVLRPGSWLVVEDLDTEGCDESIPPAAGFSVVARALFDELARRGFDQRLGLRLPALLSDAGLEAVEATTIRPRARGDVANGLPAWDLFGAQLSSALVCRGANHAGAVCRVHARHARSRHMARNASAHDRARSTTDRGFIVTSPRGGERVSSASSRAWRVGGRQRASGASPRRWVSSPPPARRGRPRESQPPARCAR